MLIEVTPVFVMVVVAVPPDCVSEIEMPVPAAIICAAFVLPFMEVMAEVRNAEQVVAPVALIVVTAFPAEQADAPPYEPSFPFASFKTSADFTEVFVMFVLVTCVVLTFTVIGLVMVVAMEVVPEPVTGPVRVMVWLPVKQVAQVMVALPPIKEPVPPVIPKGEDTMRLPDEIVPVEPPRERTPVLFIFWLEIEIPVPAPRWVVEE